MDSKKMFCRLCLNIFNDKNAKIIDSAITEILGDLLLKLRVEENIKPVMCHDCSTKLFAAYEFKATCMDTEDSIFPYVNSENEAPVDLKELYLKKRGKEHLRTILEDEKICRLCMGIACSFTSVEDVKFGIFHKYIPENLNSTKDPVICTVCLDALNSHSGFLKNCLDTEEQIKGFDDNEDNPFCINTEEIDIKSEENDEDADTSLYNDESVNHLQRRDNCQAAQMYNLDTYDFQSEYTDRFLCNQRISKNLTYKCDACDFSTKYSSSLLYHRLRHKDVSEVQMYKCDTCDYQTRQKRHLRVHQQRHQNISEASVFSCDISELKMYNCDTCSFKTKYQRSLKCHMRRHTDFSEVQTYSCNTCDYSTEQKHLFKRHLLSHRDISEVQMHNCDKCDFKTKHKSSLKRHQLVHKDISELQN